LHNKANKNISFDTDLYCPYAKLSNWIFYDPLELLIYNNNILIAGNYSEAYNPAKNSLCSCTMCCVVDPEFLSQHKFLGSLWVFISAPLKILTSICIGFHNACSVGELTSQQCCSNNDSIALPDAACHLGTSIVCCPYQTCEVACEELCNMICIPRSICNAMLELDICHHGNMEASTYNSTVINEYPWNYTGCIGDAYLGMNSSTTP
jgi:hypothetical protein